MSPKEFMEFAKMWDEFVKSNKPKEDKKPEAPKTLLSTGDYWLAIWCITAVTIPFTTCAILAYLTAFVKALHN